ncbi:hypothetical protein [Oceanobacillus sp. FSL H7-0719]|uniref:hypothetical protein n=1 Tax=Oceanobacillus sp. FSL H7-0719 TaxID=2954507 RepID=UPI00324BE179
MSNEEQIIGMLQTIMKKQDDQGRTLDEHSGILKEHSAILNEHSAILKEHSAILKEHSAILKEHSAILKEHSAILKEHSATLEKHGSLLEKQRQTLENHSSQLEEHKQLLTALISGQEYLKAELDGFKISTAKEFGVLKSEVNTIAINQEILRNDTWTNKVDIQRIKKTMGMA